MSLKEWVESLKAERERRMKKKTVLGRKWKIAIVASLASVIAAALIIGYIVPSVFGANFVSVSFDLWGRWPDLPKWDTQLVKVNLIGGKVDWMRVYTVWPNGTLLEHNSPMDVWFSYNNSYFVPVQLRYNGFDYVMFVYNRTVDDPTDVMANKDYLVWGAFYFNGEPSSFEGSSFYFYVSRRNLSNYTVTIEPGTCDRLDPFHWGIDNPGEWRYMDLNGNLVPSGTYYFYAVFYGIVAKPGPVPLKLIVNQGGN